MLSWLTKTLRSRAAIALAIAYALCVMAPPVALAFTDGAAAAHCLTEDHHAASHAHGQRDLHAHGATHVHAGGTAHQHTDEAVPTNDGSGKQAGHAAGCCGLFCFAAVAGDPGIVLGRPLPASPVPPAIDENPGGRGPDRLIRPPITL